MILYIKYSDCGRSLESIRLPLKIGLSIQIIDLGLANDDLDFVLAATPHGAQVVFLHAGVVGNGT